MRCWFCWILSGQILMPLIWWSKHWRSLRITPMDFLFLLQTFWFILLLLGTNSLIFGRSDLTSSSESQLSWNFCITHKLMNVTWYGRRRPYLIFWIIRCTEFHLTKKFHTNFLTLHIGAQIIADLSKVRIAYWLTKYKLSFGAACELIFTLLAVLPTSTKKSAG